MSVYFKPALEAPIANGPAHGLPVRAPSPITAKSTDIAPAWYDNAFPAPAMSPSSMFLRTPSATSSGILPIDFLKSCPQERSVFSILFLYFFKSKVSSGSKSNNPVCCTVDVNKGTNSITPAAA